ncbi:SusD/RagB family nutrient-binding outer membrane lipoprotein [Dyadobacter fanqingshengii]|uniref:SusD/RagB family nutrient-binding outer membrane lipoprotein n=1 Tax=Dyadobacter fanqingshengii TaxID=2906443 RepID=A0A9X1PCA0_9BACT|nr:SusD/RagB family nutrient-binding outer membrane lipoprotein [Dyadobacter fanqingshengii]MCF0041905.1 SusD/RagB family nutrient-binding outer membrane lipoprotein [Dyadobacter fanqingshengii]USJ36389.1 SusD/RagB family nutrient-binding outer membrane lipoprotein [Dyadobacter fanqingshengii]
MKAISKYLLAAVLSLCLITGCDEGFDDINTNKVDPTSLAPSLILNKAIISTTYLDGVSTLGMLTYNFGIVQQIITPYGSSLSGGNYNQFNNANTPLVWVNFYRNVIKQVVAVTDQTKDDPMQANIYHAARIWKAYAFMILTDTYGDIPYFEAGQGYISEVIRPKYDPQEAIYKDILKELDEASGALDAAQPAVTTDILYGGNVAKWKKLGYSLMLRAAMRLTKVDQNTAKTYVTKAVAGGLFESNADNSIIRHTAIYNNYIANHLAAREKTNFYLAAPFVNYLKENNDPRLAVMAVRYVGAKGGPEQVAARASSDPKLQIGMPMGYNDVTINTVLAQNGVASLWDFTQVNLTTVLKLDAPEFHITYAQNQLLLAEAAVRGWVSGTAATYFANGVRAHLEQMALYDPSAAIKEDVIQAYLKAHPLDASKALDQINTQYWVASFLDGNELFANFRRSGFPALKKNPYPGSEIKEDFIRRMPYPDSEIIVNLQNVNDANTRQGPNDLNTRVWWDKK